MIVDYRSMEIQFTSQVFKEGSTYIAHAPELDVSSCGGTKDRALKNLTEASGYSSKKPARWVPSTRS